MEEHKPDSQAVSSTIWQKLSVPMLTVGVALLVFFFQWLFGTMYPADSYRVYSNWEITELTAENLLTEKRLDGIRQTIDRKGVKSIYLDSINEISFSSAGKLISADLTFMACVPEETQGQKYHLTLSEDKTSDGHFARLERLEGYVSIEPGTLQKRVPYEALYTLSHHPMQELANQNPIASEGRFLMAASADGLTIEADRTAPALQTEIEEGLVWFVRYDGGWFTVTKAEQISPQFLPVVLAVDRPDSEPELYGWMLLEIPG